MTSSDNVFMLKGYQFDYQDRLERSIYSANSICFNP